MLQYFTPFSGLTKLPGSTKGEKSRRAPRLQLQHSTPELKLAAHTHRFT